MSCLSGNRSNPVMRLCGALIAAACMLGAAHAQPAAHANLHELGKRLEVGDVVFIRIPSQPFTQVAETTSSWTNHVGIVSDVSGAEPVIAESRVPLSGETSWSDFVKRSESGRVAVMRLGTPLDARQQRKVKQAVAARSGILYDTGFDLHSPRQFCSRFVREVLGEATGVEIGEVETFATLLQRNPQADRRFWRMWYFGEIPWQRETVTPASLLRDDRLEAYFDGYADGTAGSWNVGSRESGKSVITTGSIK
ncbi:MAG TPA: YebB family permuted papain-like enzyme [Gallionella sp.]|nr:YebB family permuted papain-like enzyme [Gallionella sp.]